MPKKSTKKATKKTTKRAVKKPKEEKVKVSESTRKMMEILVGSFGFKASKVGQVLEKIENLRFDVQYARELPDDCKEPMKAVNSVLEFLDREMFLRANIDTLIESRRFLAQNLLVLGERAAWYTSQYEKTDYQRRGWRAGSYSVLRNADISYFDFKPEKIYVTDAENQAEALALLGLESHLNLAYTANYLKYTIQTSKEALKTIDQRIAELRHERRVDPNRDSYS